MHLRLLFVTPEAEFLKLFDSVIASARELTPAQVTTAAVTAKPQLLQRVDARADDVVVLDWSLEGPETPQLVSEILQRNPQAHVVVLLPETQPQYRQQVWNAGACSSIPKEHIDQEWLSSILCVMYRAMQRELRLLATLAAGEPQPTLEDRLHCVSAGAEMRS